MELIPENQRFSKNTNFNEVKVIKILSSHCTFMYFYFSRYLYALVTLSGCRI